jgi:hypothetical protein
MVAPTRTDKELAERHKYHWTDGTPLVNVTAISGLMDLNGKSSAFAGAAVKLTKAGENYRSVWSEKAKRGSRIHAHMEAWLKGEDVEQAEDEKGFLDALEKFIVEHDPEVIEQEAIVLSARGFGGRFDLLCRIGDEVALIDLKSGSAYPVEGSLQLAAYAHADGIAVFDEDGLLTGTRPMPTIDWCACVYVHEDGTYDLRRYPADDEAFATFCKLLESYRWAQSETMKALVKEAKS